MKSGDFERDYKKMVLNKLIDIYYRPSVSALGWYFHVILFNPYCGIYPLYQSDFLQLQVIENLDATDLNGKEFIILYNREV